MKNNRPKTWRVLEWKNEPAVKGDSIPLQCEGCERVAECPAGVLTGCLLIAVAGMALITDPPGSPGPEGWLPNKIQCRKCGRVFEVKNWEEQEAERKEIEAMNREEAAYVR